MPYTREQLEYACREAIRLYDADQPGRFKRLIAQYFKRREAALRGWITRRKRLAAKQ